MISLVQSSDDYKIVHEQVFFSKNKSSHQLPFPPDLLERSESSLDLKTAPATELVKKDDHTTYHQIRGLGLVSSESHLVIFLSITV